MLIAIEGIDGAGKHTQSELLKTKAESCGAKTEILSFPRYGETVFARSIADYLNGKFGDLSSVLPQFAALLYAGDRFESLGFMKQLAQSHDLLILDRYVASNFAYQAARMDYTDCWEFISWLAQVEYEIFALPKADITVYLDIPIELASKMIYQKRKRSYTEEQADIHERDVEYLARCQKVYQTLANMHLDSKWLSIQCVGSDGTLRDVSEIHNSVWSAILQVANGDEIFCK